MNNICRRAIGLVLPGLCATCATFAADLVFSGALQQVNERSLTIRVARGVFADTRLPGKGNLAAKEIAAHYNLADQVQITRYIANQSSPDAWKQVDTIESEVTFKGSEPAREHVRINGKPWTRPYFPGIMYSFRAPPESCYGYWRNGAKRFIPARIGRIFISPAGALIQYEEEANKYPPESGASSFKEVTRWDYLRIGDGSYLLPAGYETFLRFSSGESWHIAAEFKNHRHFEASTTVTFQQ
jgi:hypothetical protein